MKPTQSEHPWRATARTVLAVALALLPALPSIFEQAGVSGYAWAGAILAFSGLVTRILAIPEVNEVLQRWLPLLAAAPKKQEESNG